MATRGGFKKKTYAWMPRSRRLRELMTSPAGVIGINWVFQGILGMDATDRWFKIGFDIVLTVGLSAVLIRFMPASGTVALSLFLAHTANWLLNGHFYVIGRYVGFTRTSVDRIWAYTSGVAARARCCPALLGAVVHGAVTRGEGIRTTSDVDVRFIRRPGLGNGFRAAWFTFLERARAFFARFPLDPYLLDDVDLLARMRTDEKPILLHDLDGVLQAYYADRGYDWLEAKN